jgi:hypothetical protein
VTLTRKERITVVGLLSVGILAVVLLIGLRIKNVYDEFPNPLSPAQMSDLADRLRNEGRPQRIIIVRKEDRKSIALAEQFGQIVESAHWVLVMPPRPPRNGVILPRGLPVWRAPTDYQALALSRALIFADLPYETLTDIELTNSGYLVLSISDGWFDPPHE